MSRSDDPPPSSRQLPPRVDPRAGRTPRQATTAAAAPRRASTGRHSLSRAALGARIVAGLVSVVLLATTGWGWYLGRVVEASVNRTDAIPTAGNEGDATVDKPGEAMNLLLVGNDSRANATPEELDQLNTEANDGINTDTMILVHVPANGSKASFVSFARDSYVKIPGHGMDKLNAAYAFGMLDAPETASDGQKQAAGAQLLIRTISQLTGLQVDHYAEVDLLGFFNLSNVVGGVEVNLCNTVQDSFSGVDLPAGVQTISGSQALSFVRQRHGLPRGDFDRIVRQQTFIAGMIRKILSENVLLDLGKQRRLVEAAATSLTIDRSLDLFDLAGQMQSVTAGAIDFQTVPYIGDDTDEAGRYILRLQDREFLRDFFAGLSAEPESPAPAGPTTAATTVDPSEVSVAVYNGSGLAGEAATAADQLEAAGFTVASTGNADSTEYSATEIRYAAGDEAMAATLAAVIPGATTAQVDDVDSGMVQLVLGSDFNNIGQALTAPEAETAAPVDGEDPRTAADTTCIN